MKSGRIALALALAALTLQPMHPLAQGSAPRDPATDKDVLGNQRLFSAWLEGQIAYRGLPGIVVGVVADQELVWASGFGFADVAAKVPMTPQTRFRMASHSKLFTATAIMQLREQGKLHLDDPVAKHLPWFTVKSAERRRPADHHRGPADAQLRPAARGRRALDHLRVPDARGAAQPDARAPGGLSAEISLEVLEPRLHARRAHRRAGERRAWADYVQPHLPSARDERFQRRQERPGLAARLRPPDAGRIARDHAVRRRARDGRGNRHHFTVEDMAKFVSAQFRKGTAGGARSSSTGSLREMHRVRMLENNWTRATPSASRSRGRGTSCTSATAAAIPATRPNADPARRQGRRHRPHQRQRLEPGDIAHAVDEHGRAKPWPRRRPPLRQGHVGSVLVALRGTLSRPLGRFARGGAERAARDHHPDAPNLDNPVRARADRRRQFRFVAPAGGGPSARSSASSRRAAGWSG